MTIKAPANAATAEWRAHWKTPLVAAIALAVSVIPNYSLGALMPEIQADTGWSRAGISAGTLIIAVFTLAIAPFVGTALDRFGTRRVALPGLVMFLSAIAGLSLVGTSIESWWFGWTLIGCANAFANTTVWTSAVVGKFDISRGLALSVTLSGTGLASFSLPYIATILEQSYGWRGAYLMMGMVGLAISLPLVWLFIDFPAQRRVAPKVAPPSERPGLPARSAILSRRYPQILFAAFLVSTAMAAVIIHFVPILEERGLMAVNAAIAASGLGIGTVTGRLATGVLLDRYHGPFVGLFAFLLPAFSAAYLLFSDGTGGEFIVALVIGLGLGAEFDIIAYLTTRYFGLRHFGLLFAIIVSLVTAGGGVGPIMAGFIYDQFESYDILLAIVIPMFIVSALMVGSLGNYPETFER